MLTSSAFAGSAALYDKLVRAGIVTRAKLFKAAGSRAD